MKRSLIIAVVTGALALLSSCSAAKENAAPSPTTSAVAAASPDANIQWPPRLTQRIAQMPTSAMTQYRRMRVVASLLK